MNNNTNNQNTPETKKGRGRPKGSKNKPKGNEAILNLTISNGQITTESQPTQPTLTFLKGGLYDDLEWYRLRMKKNKENEMRIQNERRNGNGKIVRSLRK